MMARVALGALALVWVLLAAPSSAVAHTFKFKIPTGWVDLSPEVPADSLKNVPAYLLEYRQAQKYAVLAMDIRNQHLVAQFDVTIIDLPPDPSAPQISQSELLEMMMEQFPLIVAENAAAEGADIQILDKKLEDLGSRKIFRIEARNRSDKILFYIIFNIAYNQAAMLRYRTGEVSYPLYKSLFESSAKATITNFESGTPPAATPQSEPPALNEPNAAVSNAVDGGNPEPAYRAPTSNYDNNKYLSGKPDDTVWIISFIVIAIIGMIGLGFWFMRTPPERSGLNMQKRPPS